MANTEETIVSIEFDTGTAEEKIENIEELLKSLGKSAENISAEISEGFKGITSLFDKLDKSIGSLSESLTGISLSIRDILAQMKGSDVGGQLFDGFVFSVETLLTILGNKEAIIAAVSKLGGKFAGFLGSTAGIITVVAVAIIALVAIIITHWDEIVVFFTQTLPAALAPIGQWIRDSIITPFLESPVADWLYTNVLQPVIEAFTPIAGYIYNVLIVPLIQSFKDSWNEMQQELADLVTWVDEKLIQPIVGFVKAALEWLSPMLEGIWQFISDGVYNVVSFVATAIQMIFALCATIKAWVYLHVTKPISDFFNELFNGISDRCTNTWENIMAFLAPGIQWLEDNLLVPLGEFFKALINEVISHLNSMVSGIILAINWIIRALNRLQFTVPDWVPEFGGQTFGFKLKELTAPQIPYLAKGAVLPANRPFLAVVGDQRHGTNVEAPLATIQEAVGLVMNDHISAMMAGFRALLEEQQATRRTIEGIEIGDRVIGEAAQRYQRKMAVTYGTF